MDKCPKCGGLVLIVRTECTMGDIFLIETINMYRCLNCGLMFDKQWLANRKAGHIVDLSKGRRKGRYHYDGKYRKGRYHYERKKEKEMEDGV